ncbi:hypothetical protein A2U01_0068953, partial [Trifolium medium]|nr:hypothetical protein [Trifolium medium]
LFQTLPSRCRFFLWWCDERRAPPHHLGPVSAPPLLFLLWVLVVGSLGSVLVFLSSLRRPVAVLCRSVFVVDLSS